MRGDVADMEERRNLRCLYIGMTLRGLADGMRWALLPVVTAHIGGSAFAVAAVTAVSRAPWPLTGVLGGGLVDRCDKRRLLSVSLWVLALASAGLASWTDAVEMAFWLVLACAFLAGAAEVIADNTAQTIVPDITSSQQLAKVNATLQGIFVVTAQLLAGFIAGVAFEQLRNMAWLSVASFYLSSGLIIGMLRGNFKSEPQRGSVLEDVRHAVDWLRKSHFVRYLSVSSAFHNVFGGASMAVLILLVERDLRGTPAHYGMALSVSGIGALSASLWAGRIRQRIVWRIFPLLNTIMALSALLAATSRNVWMLCFVMALKGFAVGAWNITSLVVRQMAIPSRVLGRVNAMYRLIAWGGLPVGALMGGVVVSQFGPRAPFILEGLCLLLLSSWLYAVLRRKDAQITIPCAGS